MNIQPKPAQSLCPVVQTRDVATQTEASAINHLGKEVKLIAPRYLYNTSFPHQRTKVCQDELSRKIKIIRTNTSLINFPLVETTLLAKYGLSKCIAKEQGKRFIAECAIATAINVQMPIGKTEGRLEGGGLQYLGECINSLETLMVEGWNIEASKRLKKNLVYETTRITIPYENLDSDRKDAVKNYILKNQTLFVNDAATEKTTQALNLFRHQLAHQNALGLYPRTPQLFDLSSPQTIIDIEANRVFPGDESGVLKIRGVLQAKMNRVLSQMTDPDSELVSMMLDDKRAAGMLAAGDKQILRTALTNRHAQMPIPGPEACLFYLQFAFEFRASLMSSGLDPEALSSMIVGCLNMHQLARRNQKIQQVEISWESLLYAWSQSSKILSVLSHIKTSDDMEALVKECRKQLTYVPDTNFFRMINIPWVCKKLKITPQYAPEYHQNNQLSSSSGPGSMANSGNDTRKRPANSDDTVPHSSKMARPAE